MDVTQTKDGKPGSYSVQTRRKSIRQSSSLAQVLEDKALMLSTDSLEKDEETFGPRCSSPTSIRKCNGFCDRTDIPPVGATVVRT